MEEGRREKGGGRETQTGEEAAGTDLPVCVPLSSKVCRQLSPPTQRPGLLWPGAGHSCRQQGEARHSLPGSCSPCPLEVGQMGKLVLLLNGKAREILAKH